jgi:hypothetical protein
MICDDDERLDEIDFDGFGFASARNVVNTRSIHSPNDGNLNSN